MIAFTLVSAVTIAALLASLAVFFYRIGFLYRIMRVGKPEYRLDKILRRLASLVKYVLGQRSTVRGDRFGGAIHILIFWGFILLVPEVTESFGMAVDPTLSLAFLGEPLFTAVKVMQDVASVMVIVGVALAFFRRYALHPEKLENTPEANFILVLIALVIVTQFGFAGFQLASPSGEAPWMPLSQVFASWIAGAGLSAGTLEAGGQAFMMGHILVLLFFLSYVPFTRKHLHLVAIVPNVFLRQLGPRGALAYMDLEKEETLGAGRIDAFGWKQLLDLYTCTECGRCQDNCPAYNTKKPLNPKKVILDMKENLLLNGKPLMRKDEKNLVPLIGGPISEDVLWSCTTCAACVDQCPVFIEHVHKIVEMRRYLTLTEGKIADEIAKTFKEMEVSGNPWGFPPSERSAWTEPLGLAEVKGQPADLLLFVGCFSSYDDRNKATVSSLVRLLKTAGVKFTILGDDETCCGDPARRLGNEYIFQTMAQENIRKFNELNVKKIITACPHCFNTLKNEYPQLGGKFEVIHHTQLLRELLAEGKLKPSKPLNLSLTYHDSCYLGRYNGIYDEPREILERIPGVELREMDRRRSISFCCGAGGGRIWMEEEIGERINVERVKQAESKGVAGIATACPFCMNMFEDGLKTLGKEDAIQALDLAELLEKSL
ncbi:MAG: (Fe-S)-binding protein [Candidatus Bathyarchaeia archaeon]